MYHFSVAKLFLFNIALGFLFGAGSFLALRALSFSPLGALVGGMHLSFAFCLVVGFYLWSKERIAAARTTI
jgi:hypothetical protein